MFFSRDSVEFGRKAHPVLRPRRGLLSSFSTGLGATPGFVLALASTVALSLMACQLVTNDLRNRPLPGHDSIYKPELRPGSSARELMSPGKFRKLIIEIQYMPGMNPSQEALNHLVTFVERVLGRDERQIEIVLGDPIPSGNKRAYSLVDVRDIEARHRRVRTQKDTLAIYALFVDGPSADDRGPRKLLGQAYQNTSIVIYEDTIRGLIDPNAPVWVAEATIIEHEFGHLLGLTNLATPAQSRHEDSEHRGHCANPTCLMYHSSENSEILPSLNGRVPELDAECLRDLEALVAKR